MSKFKEGQMVRHQNGKIYTISIPECTSNYELVMAIELGKTGLAEQIHNSYLVILTRDEIIQHMKDNGWEYNEINTVFAKRNIVPGKRQSVAIQLNGNNWESLTISTSIITPDWIKAQQEAHNYATALNLCEQ